MLRHRADLALAAGLTILGFGLTLDGTIWATLLIGAVTLPVAWRHRAPLAASLAFAAGSVISAIPTFDQTRCGVAIPAALLIVFTLGVQANRAAAWTGLAAVLAGLTFLLFTDPVLDAGAAFFLPLAAAIWLAGRWVRVRARRSAELADRTAELAATKQKRADFAVDIERARLATVVDATLRERLGTIRELIAAEAAFQDIEQEARMALNEVRGLLGALRSVDA